MTESVSVFDDLEASESRGLQALLLRLAGSLVVRLGLGALVLFALTAAFLASSVVERERQRVLSDWGQQVADAASSYMGVHGAAWIAAPTAEDREVLDRNLLPFLDVVADAGVALYREDGRIIYSSDPDAVGTVVEDLAPALAGSLQGRVVDATVEPASALPYDARAGADGVPPTEVVRSVVPVGLDENDPNAGVILEAARSYDSVRAATRSVQGIIWGGFAVAYVLLMLAAVPLISRSDRLLRERTAVLRGLLKRQRDTVDQLNAADTLKNRYLTAVSYELRTPMQAISLLTDRLRTHGASMEPDRLRDVVERLDRNTQQLQRRLTDLLDVDLLAQGGLEARRRPTDMAELVRQAIAEMEAADRRVEPPGGRLEATVDTGLVLRAVEHMLENAVEHTPAGTPVHVRVEPFEGGATIVVEDEGPGVPREQRASIFEPLVSGKTPSGQPGAGIGLTLVRAIAELHGGRVWVEDREGGGASFHLRLPNSGSVAGRTAANRVRNA